MEYIAGTIVAIVIAALASFLNIDKDRSFYSMVLIIIAIFYIFFAIMSESSEAIIKESIVAFLFITAAIIGAKTTVLVVAIGLIAHGAFDILHNQFITNQAVPLWWPKFCAVVDILLGAWVIYLAKKRSTKSIQPPAESGG